jgi:hypothetical protein
MSKNKVENNTERLIIYGVYSHTLADYISYYKNEEDAVKVLESRVYENTKIDYNRNVLITTDEEEYVIMAVHPIVVN